MLSCGLEVLKDPEFTLFEFEDFDSVLSVLLLKDPEFTLFEFLLETTPLSFIVLDFGVVLDLDEDFVEKEPELTLFELRLVVEDLVEDDLLLDDLVEPDFGFAWTVYTLPSPTLIIIQLIKTQRNLFKNILFLFIAIKSYKNIINFI